MPFMLRKISTFILVVVVFTVFSGGILHATVPHQHGLGNFNSDGTSGNVSVIWQGLHSALLHDKKDLVSSSLNFPPPTPFGNTELLLVSLILVHLLLYKVLVFLPYLSNALHRGIIPSRKFV